MSSRHWLLLGGTVVLAAMGVVHSSAQGGAPRPADDVAVSGRVLGARPSVSADGAVAVFEGEPSTDDDTRSRTVFVKDLLTGTVGELTTVVDGVRPGDSVQPVVSADGCRVVVVTQLALDLFRDDDTGTRWDVYATTLPRCGGRAGSWELVSTRGGSSVGTAAADDVDPSYAPAVSGEGSVVAYTHRLAAGGLAPSPDAGSVVSVSVVDLGIPLGGAGRVRQVPGTPQVVPTDGSTRAGVRAPSMSRDGTVVAVTSDADHTSGSWGRVDGVGPTAADPAAVDPAADDRVIVWDRTLLDPAVTLTALPAAGASQPAVSADGSAVAFVSADTDALPDGVVAGSCEASCPSQVFVWERADGALRLASSVVAPDGTVAAGNGPSSQPVLDRTGASAVFVSRATNLLPRRSPVVGGPDDGDVVQAVLASGTVHRVSLDSDGVTPLPATNAHPTVSADGRVVVFDRLGGPTGLVRDLMVVRRSPAVVAAGIDLGTVAVGFPGPEWYVTVHNTGLTEFAATEVESDTDEFLVTGGSCAEDPVAPGESCTVYVVFVPERDGVRTGTVTVADTEGVTVEVSVGGRGGEPELEPLPAGADAAPTTVGDTSEPVQYTITNIAFLPTTIESIVIAGADPDDFAVSDDQCTGRRLDALDVCTVDVVFSPTAAGRRAATVVATTDRGADSTMLIGGLGRFTPSLGVAAPAVVSPGIVTVRGTGFAAGVDVLVAWSDGIGSTMRVTSDGSGAFVAQLVVRPNERGGVRTLVAQALDGAAARVDVLVVSRRPGPGPSSPRWPG